TGRSQHITITASSGLSEAEIEKMRKDAEAHADEDRKRKELIEARNNADSVVYTSEKLLRENGDKVPADMKQQVEEGVRKVRDAMNSEDVETIKRASDDLGQVLQKMGASMYQQPEAGSAAGPQGDQDGGQQAPPSGDGGDDVVDGEFKNAG
ncbi:MAG TPA: Hsp70 family protein, partial [Anaerolineaceae bacterium]|nr:Hsp70 family protein [Anaerolineaceae bacterium]